MRLGRAITAVGTSGLLVVGALTACVEHEGPDAAVGGTHQQAQAQAVIDSCMKERDLGMFRICLDDRGLTLDQKQEAVVRWQHEEKLRRLEEARVAGEERRAKDVVIEKQEAKEAAEKKKTAERRAREAWEGSIESRCMRDLTLAVCKDAPDDVNESAIAKCRTDCKDAIRTKVDAIYAVEKDDCVARFTAASGNGKIECDARLPIGATVDDTDARDKACTSTCLKEGPPALAKAKIEAKERAEREAQAKAADSEGRRLVIGYHQCMIDADSSYTARKYCAYDPPLYVTYMNAEDVKCFEKYKCAWLEKNSDWACTYKFNC